MVLTNLAKDRAGKVRRVVSAKYEIDRLRIDCYYQRIQAANHPSRTREQDCRGVEETNSVSWTDGLCTRSYRRERLVEVRVSFDIAR
jgi:hypothetical protein